MKFEYFWLNEQPMDTSDTLAAKLNKVGEQGWELVSVVPMQTVAGRCSFFFKRQVKHEAFYAWLDQQEKAATALKSAPF